MNACAGNRVGYLRRLGQDTSQEEAHVQLVTGDRSSLISWNACTDERQSVESTVTDTSPTEGEGWLC